MTELESDGNHLVLVEAQPRLLARAGWKLRNGCADPRAHREEVVQQVNLQYLQAIKNRNSGYDEPIAVLFTAVDNAAATHREKCRREESVDFNGPCPPKEIVQRTLNPSQLWDGLIEIEEKLRNVSDRDLFYCFYVEGQTQVEIATRRGWTSIQIHRAVNKLNRELGIASDKLRKYCKRGVARS